VGPAPLNLYELQELSLRFSVAFELHIERLLQHGIAARAATPRSVDIFSDAGKHKRKCLGS